MIGRTDHIYGRLRRALIMIQRPRPACNQRQKDLSIWFGLRQRRLLDRGAVRTLKPMTLRLRQAKGEEKQKRNRTTIDRT